jgi:G:T-mismatch repair DNA endonuclease (very short patch repair protein)
MTAAEIWNRDAARKQFLETLGYNVEIVWERDVK